MLEEFKRQATESEVERLQEKKSVNFSLVSSAQTGETYTIIDFSLSKVSILPPRDTIDMEDPTLDFGTGTWGDRLFCKGELSDEEKVRITDVMRAYSDLAEIKKAVQKIIIEHNMKLN